MLLPAARGWLSDPRIKGSHPPPSLWECVEDVLFPVTAFLLFENVPPNIDIVKYGVQDPIYVCSSFHTVSVMNTSPAFKIGVGKFLWWMASGQHWVSRQTAERGP